MRLYLGFWIYEFAILAMVAVLMNTTDLGIRAMTVFVLGQLLMFVIMAVACVVMLVNGIRSGRAWKNKSLYLFVPLVGLAAMIYVIPLVWEMAVWNWNLPPFPPFKP